MSPHEKLFNRYRKSLLLAKPDVETWWVALLAREEQHAADAEAARKQMTRRWPSGPGSHPRIIGIIRATYLACLELNEDENGAEVEPHVLMTEWLLDGQSDDLVEFLAPLSYWPIGFDEDGEEC